MAADEVARSLPPIRAFESDKYRPEEGYTGKQIERPSNVMTPSTFTPVAYSRPAPPPFTAPTPSSYAPSTASAPSSFSAGFPSRSQEAREPPKEMASSSSQQSLPSIAEAIGVDRIAAPYPAEPVSPRSINNTSASPRSRVGSTTDSPRHAPVYGHQASHPPQEQPNGRHAGPDVPEYHRRRDYPEQVGHDYAHRSAIPPVQHVRAPPPPVEASRPYENAAAQPQPPRSQFGFGYAPSSASFPPPTAARPPMAPPSYPSSAPEPSHAWPPRHGSVSAAPPPPPPAPVRQPFTVSVQKHLDLYEFEMSFRELSEQGAVLLDFGRSYGGRVQQAQRSGIIPGTLPAISEIEDMMNKSRGNYDSLSRLRDVMIAHHASNFHHPQEPVYAEAARNDSFHHHDEGKLGSAEPKKRRGRNAAPGRCHSCNRAETPEWRRGPDGARTLCNACGLHYAKLTRKAGASKAAAESTQLALKHGDDAA